MLGLGLAGCAARGPQTAPNTAAVTSSADAGEEEESLASEESLSKEGVPDEEAEHYIAVEDPFPMALGIPSEAEYFNSLPIVDSDQICRLKPDPLTQIQDPFPLNIQRMEKDPRFDIPIFVNDSVERWITYFQTTARKHFVRWLERSGRYIPMMRKILRENGLPEDLVYLSMIESGFNTAAFSRARASGPWQFISATGKRYGLKADWWIDERRDPEKSTIAAAQHLKDLYDQFQSWYLAYASYNAGAAKIDKAIRRYNTEDFWEMTRGRYLKSETKNYVPKMIAAALIAKDPEKYGFTDIQYEPPLAYDKVVIPEPTDLEVIAKAAGVSVEEIRTLNPELKRWFTPPHYPNYELKLPVGAGTRFSAEYEKLKPAERLAFQYHRLTRHQSLSSIARRYGLSVEALMKFNGIQQARRLRPGTVLVIPVSGDAALALNQPPPPEEERPVRRASRSLRARRSLAEPPAGSEAPRTAVLSGNRTVYTVTSGDTLWSISRSFNVTVSQLRRWNNLRSGRRIQAGQKLAIEAPAAEGGEKNAKVVAGGRSALEYRVKSGDTLFAIARNNDVSLEELRRLNRLQAGEPLRSGTTLKLAVAAPAKDSAKKESENRPTRYTVQRGDTLWSIAQRFGISVGQLKTWNKLLFEDELQAGQEIRVVAGL